MKKIKVGVISDTHGLLRTEVEANLAGCEHIIHAGDIDNPRLIPKLEEIAPLTIVQGNMDFGPWTQKIRQYEEVELAGYKIFVLHNLHYLPDLETKPDLVIFGHTHEFFAKTKDDVLYFNPGSCGPKRFNLDITMAILTLGTEISFEKIMLKNEA